MDTIRSCLECGTLFAGSSCPTCREREETRDRLSREAGALQAEQMFHGMRILQQIDRGGMGLLYKAREIATGKIVALKILPPERATDPQFGGRFAREAKALASLSHPNIVAIRNFGTERDLYFLSMEFISGISLRKYMAGRALPLGETLPVLTQLLDALQYAHEQGVVHRDIKPENLILDRTGRLKVMDFGLAKLRSDSLAGLTDTFTHLGTDRYRAPEQVSNPKGVDHRADIYSTGVVLFEMLTGRLPALGSPALPDARMQHVVSKALAVKPEERFQTVAEFRDEILSATAV